MSQAKVDRYKESKKNRKQEVKKAKRNKMLAKLIGTLAAAAVVCWIGFSGYSYFKAQQPITKTEVDTSAITDYLSSLTSTAEEE